MNNIKLVKKIITPFLVLLIVVSCQKNEENTTTCKTSNPLEDIAWLKEIKDEFVATDQNTGSTKKMQIIQYTYKNNTVFYIDGCVNCPDYQSNVYSCTKEVLCTFGGIAGVNTCPDFDTEATNKMILWEN